MERAESSEVEEKSRFQEARREMVESQLRRRGIKSAEVLLAFEDVPRHCFVPEDLVGSAYQDRPLPIGLEQTISQPYIVALMTERLMPLRGQKVLEIGGGCGYQSAILARLGAQVFSIERIAWLAERARQTLNRLKLSVQVRVADGALGWPEAGPFSRILVACAAPEIPRALVDQLSPGGRLILPVGASGQVQSLVAVDKDSAGEVVEKPLLDVRFVPMLSGVDAARSK